MTEEISTVLMNSSNVSSTENEAPTTVVPTESVYNLSRVEQSSYNGTQTQDDVFEAFNILEIIMTSVELMVWIMAAIKMPRWRRNYRNQMLMQISVARFIKRVIFSFKFLQEKDKLSSWAHADVALNSSQTYIDFVIVILVFFFIKHMYDSLITVLVKMRQTSLYKVSICSWLVPIPVSAVWTVIILSKAIDSWVVYLLICCLFRWPLIFMGTAVYITVLYKVLSDKIRRFASSLTVVTFLMCLVINFYLFSKDVIQLWCFNSFGTVLISYVSGLIMNFLILSLYIILISMDYKHQTPKTINSIPNYSLADSCCKESNIIYDEEI